MRGLLTLLLFSTAAHAAPLVHVKARPQIFDLSARSVGLKITVSGTLRDDRGQPLPNAGLVVLLGTRRVVSTTDGAGRFQVSGTAAALGDLQIGVEYAGGPLTGTASASTALSVGLRPVSLSVDLPPEIGADEPRSITTQALDDRSHPLPALAVTVTINGGRAIDGVTGADGRAKFQLAAFAAGEHIIRVATPGDRDRKAASITRKFVAVRPLGISLDPPATDLSPGDPIVLSGDIRGGPPETAVTLILDGETAERVETRGARFRFVLDADDVGGGTHTAHVAARATTPGWRGAASAPISFEVPPPPPPSKWWTWGPLALVAIAVGGALFRRRPAPRAVPPPLPPAPPAPVVYDLAPVLSSGLDLHVVDSITGQSVPARLVALAEPPAGFDPAATAPPGVASTTDANGRHRLVETPGWLWAHAPGYAPAAHQPPPHAQHATLRLAPLRAHLQVLYADVLNVAGRPSVRFGHHTPSEAEPILRSRGAKADPLTELTAVIEVACFGASTPTATDHARVLKLTADVRASLNA